jgi:beta-mannosidase
MWTACDGAMTVAAALGAGRTLDLEHVPDLDASDWWYRCHFSFPGGDGPVRLRFDGLATVVDVWLNGEHLLRSDSMFVAHVVEAAQRLRSENELVLQCHALVPLLAAARRPRPRWRTGLVGHQGLRWYRTSLLGRMPAWCPPVPPVGPWRPILIDTAALQIEQASLRADLDGDEGTVRLQLSTTGRAEARLEGTLTVGEWEAPIDCSQMPDGQRVLTATVRVPHPARWWPHTHGEAPLYAARARLTFGRRAELVDLGRVGFRTLAVDRGPDGQGFGLILNGVPIFSRGVCWTPLDLATLGADAATYREALQQIRAGGMNIVRIPGTTTYETGMFHDLCDELGLLVWQDFMFANMDYPADNETFRRLALLEARQVLDSIQARPSLAVVCGGSEIGQQAAMLGSSARTGPPSLFDEELSRLAQHIAAGAVWVPETPTGGTFPFHVNAGISHYYGVGAYRRPLNDARLASVRFAAECLAFSNVPEASTIDLVLRDGERAGANLRWKARVPRDAGAGWDFEDARDHYVEQLFGVAPAALRAVDPERYLALGRVATGEVMLRTFAEWRRPGSSCRGGLVWFGRDLWPGAGWGVVDSTGLPKAAYWFLKRVLAPVALLAADEGLNGLWFHAVNDTVDSIDAELRVALYRNGVRCGADACTIINIPARGHRAVHADALFDGFLDLTYAYRFGPPGHDVIAATLSDCLTHTVRAEASYYPRRLPAGRSDIGLTAVAEPTGQDYSLELSAERFAHAVAIDFEGCVPEDNYLVLEPGRRRRILLRRKQPSLTPRGHVTALNSAAPVPIVVMEAAGAR